MDATCKTCPFWQYDRDAAARGWSGRDTPGDCRASPPNVEFGWPKTRPDDWCAAHPHRPSGGNDEGGRSDG